MSQGLIAWVLRPKENVGLQDDSTGVMTAGACFRRWGVTGCHIAAIRWQEWVFTMSQTSRPGCS
jgi:hypothetical protein